ncbi:MAG TPA: trigger factor, partial [Solibacillus sp.]
VKTKVLPELTDEFAKEIDPEVETVEALKAKLKETTIASKEADVEATLRDELVEKAAENAEVVIPQGMINTEVDRMIQEFGQRLQMQGMNLDLYYQFSGQDEAALRAQMAEEAGNRVKVSLVLEAIGQAEGIEVTEEEINAEIEKMSAQFGMDKDQILTALGGSSTILENDIRTQKTVELLVENAKIN